MARVVIGVAKSQIVARRLRREFDPFGTENLGLFEDGLGGLLLFVGRVTTEEKAKRYARGLQEYSLRAEYVPG